MTVTEKDLLQQRVEITREQMDARHSQAQQLQEVLISYQDNLEKKIDQYLIESKEFHRDILERLDKLENKFAGKWTEKIIIGIGASIGVIIIGALMSLIITNGK